MKKILLSVLTVLALVSCVREGIPEETPLRSYDITAVKSYGSLEELLNETGYSMMGFGFLLSFYFPDYNKPVSAISYTYLSEDPQGKPVELSALLYIPDAALNGTKALTGISLTSHGTIASNSECPTMKAQFGGVLAWRNYAIVMPDSTPTWPPASCWKTGRLSSRPGCSASATRRAGSIPWPTSSMSPSIPNSISVSRK